MPRSRPDAARLIEAAVAYLESELMPALDGYHRFQTRVSANALRMAARELRLGAAQAEAERGRLAALLGRDGDAESLSAALAQQIRDGTYEGDDAALRAHLRETLREALAINNPKWLEK